MHAVHARHCTSACYNNQFNAVEERRGYAISGPLGQRGADWQVQTRRLSMPHEPGSYTDLSLTGIRLKQNVRKNY